jgi:hypothetical protein
MLSEEFCCVEDDVLKSWWGDIPLGLSGTEGISRLLKKFSKTSSASMYLSFRSSLVSNKLAAA